MTLRLSLLLAACLAAGPAGAQRALAPPAVHWPLPADALALPGVATPSADRTGGPDTFGYTFVDSTEPGGPGFNWVDLSVTGTEATGALGDNVAQLVALPFPFNFYGTVYTAVRISSNGYLDFDHVTPDYDTHNEVIPAPIGVNNVASVLWDDFDTSPAASPGGSVRYRNMADGRFVVSWINVRPSCGPPPPGGCAGPPQTFQVVLRDNHTLKYQYLTVSGTPRSSSTIGVENANGSDGVQVSFNESPAYVANNLAITFRPPSPIPATDVAYDESEVISERPFVPAFNDDFERYAAQTIRVTLSGAVGTLPVTAFTFSVSGTIPPAGISEIRVFAFPTYDTATVTNPGTGTVTVPVDLTLSPGANEFYVSYTFNSAAVVGSTVTTEFTSLTVDGVAHTPTDGGGTGVITIVDPPPGDDFADARPLQRALLTEGTNLYASEEAYETDASCSLNGYGGFHSVWYSYNPPQNGHVTFNTFGSAVENTVLSVHTGDDVSSLTEIACSDDALFNGVPSLHSEVDSVAVMAGTTYYIRVASAVGNAVGTTTGDFLLSYIPLDLPEPYAFTTVTGGERWALGDKEKFKWTGPNVPDADEMADVYLRNGNGPWLHVEEVKNKGTLVYNVDPALAPSAAYTAAVQSQDVGTAYAISDPFTIYDPANTFVFTRPLPAEAVARGQDQTFTWTTPAGSAGDVRLRLYRGVTQVFTVVIPNTGSYTYSVPASQTLGAHYFTIQDVGDALYYGESELFTIARFQVDAPVAGVVWTAGETRTVAWSGSGPNPNGTLKVLLKRKGFPNTTLANNVPYSDGEVTVMVPAVTPSDDYFLTLVYEHVSPTPFTLNSLDFTVEGAPVPAPLAARHFAVPTGVEDWTELTVHVPGLPDGAEVAARAGAVLLGAGRLVDGEASVWVPNTYLDAEGDESAVSPDASLTLVASDGGDEVPLVVASVVSGATGEAVPLALAADDVLFVSAAVGEAVEAGALPSAFALEQAQPNPMAGASTVRVALPEAARVRLTAYDGLGRRVAVLLDGEREAGTHAVRFDASTLASGVYVLRLEAGTFTATQRVTVVR